MMKSTPVFVTCDTPTPAARPVLLNKPATAIKQAAGAFNATTHATTQTPKGKPTMPHPTDAQLLQDLASRKATDASYCVNVHDLAGARQALSAAQSYIDRLIQARGIQANALTDDFAGYDINNPDGDQPAAVTGNAGQPFDEFANYSINDL